MAESPADTKLFMGRQPILDRDQSLVAYELLFRSAKSLLQANVTDYAHASASVIHSAITNFGLNELLGRHKGFFNVSLELLMDDALELLPRNQVVIELLETIQPSEIVVARCNELKRKGFSLALDDNLFDPSFAPLYELVDIVKVDLLMTTPDALSPMVQQYSNWPLTLLAEKVENMEMFQLCHGLGFHLFQGYYFARPVVLNKRRVDVSGISLLKLIDLVISDAEIQEIEETFRRNPSLAYNLLRLVNSVAMGLRERIKTLRHAIVVLGRQQLKRWAQLALYASKGGDTIMSPLLEVAAMRGRLMELLVIKNAQLGIDRESAERAFMTGVLSLIDVLFETSMDDVVRQLNLADDIRQALQGRNGYLGLLLMLAERLEESDFAGVLPLLAQLKVKEDVLMAAQREAIQWTNNLAEIA
ncbi:EAL and HDOD domain-containing protein [Geobacter argillaceus]|uniref:EAL and modified HD-GYP domain-containing signal transduction protein n=1 Tax=Geobacter argillaceus TaxID=345631 RepID=A0A562WQD4_9BACT|nr:HDOD domain-containing protein [Geobacter argillaceus]TWJ32560.1 EAL and modified HD-GYP domain-containing signal transduction protein [Geobacter argillaceus]